MDHEENTSTHSEELHTGFREHESHETSTTTTEQIQMPPDDVPEKAEQAEKAEKAELDSVGAHRSDPVAIRVITEEPEERYAPFVQDLRALGANVELIDLGSMAIDLHAPPPPGLYWCRLSGSAPVQGSQSSFCVRTRSCRSWHITRNLDRATTSWSTALP